MFFPKLQITTFLDTMIIGCSSNGMVFGSIAFKKFQMRIVLINFLFFIVSQPLLAQNTPVQDSLERRMALMTQLFAAQNFERAQFEAEDFRWFLRREKVLVPHRAITLLADIYLQNKDKLSADIFLAEAERDARRQRDIDEKTLMLNALIKSYEKWQLPEKALATQRQLAVAQDSLASRKVTAEALRWRRQLDSLTTLRKIEIENRATFFEIEKSKAIIIGAGLLALVVLLLLANLLIARRWRKKLAEKEQETDFLRSQRFTAQSQIPEPIPPSTPIEPTSPVLAATVNTTKEYIPPKPGEIWAAPLKTALVIEPNRKIVIYLKTLLADEFEVHTTYTPYEGLQMAAELLPDLIVCDAVLNGKTGIEVIREIKFDQRTNHIPVMMLTGKTGNEAKLDALGAGADLYFPRPLLDTELTAQVKLLFGARKAQHQEFSRTLHLFFTDNRPLISDPFLEKTMSFIEGNLHDPDFTPEALSKKMLLTKFHFQKKLFAMTGREAAQLIREMRLEKAKMMLERRLAPVTKVSELVGYTNTGTFSMNFKEYFGDNTVLMQGYKVSGFLNE